MIHAIYPGTFDPITMGHIDLIERAAKVFPQIIVAVATDTNKNTLFNLAERVQMADYEIKKINTNSCIKVLPFKGLLIDFAKLQNCEVILRGLRAASDFEYEFQMSYVNYKLAPELETMFIPATSKSHFIASKFVREIARLKGNLTSFVSTDVAKKLMQKFEHE